jgi:hypothetical protein
MSGFTLSCSNLSLAVDRSTSSGGMGILRLGEQNTEIWVFMVENWFVSHLLLSLLFHI